jgi:Acetamidase/Formamidase family
VLGAFGSFRPGIMAPLPQFTEASQGADPAPRRVPGAMRDGEPYDSGASFVLLFTLERGRAAGSPPMVGAGTARRARIQLPAYAEGAKFSAGDGHMARGGGEVCVTAVEILMDECLTPFLQVNRHAGHCWALSATCSCLAGRSLLWGVLGCSEPWRHRERLSAGVQAMSSRQDRDPDVGRPVRACCGGHSPGWEGSEDVTCLCQQVTARFLAAGLDLHSALSILGEGPAAERCARALGELDDAIGEVRRLVLAAHKCAAGGRSLDDRTRWGPWRARSGMPPPVRAPVWHAAQREKHP